MAAWQAKTTDEKLLDIHKRLLKLEANPASYQLLKQIQQAAQPLESDG